MSAAEAGYACVVVKTFDEPVTELVATAQRSGVVLLATDDAVAWHHLAAMITSALAPRSGVTCSRWPTRSPGWSAAPP
ncbi:hypothetical protein GCM10029964_080070 [Kibdelosporangium lantanae]